MRMNIPVALAFAIAVPQTACSGSTTGPSSDGAFQITVASTAITNQTGKGLIMTIQQEGQSTNIGRACQSIASSPFTLSVTPITDIPANGNLCDPGFANKKFPAGRYTLTTQLVTLPSLAPERTITQSVVVNDHTAVTINGTALSR